MMAGAIGDLLEDFSPALRGEPLGIGALRAVKSAPEPEQRPAQTAVDQHVEVIKIAETRVRAEEREVAERQLNEAIAAERARYEDELKTQRMIWVEEHANQLQTQIVESIARIESTLSEKVAGILKPFVTEAFRQQSIAEFKQALETLLLGEEGKIMKIVGPDDIISVLKINLSAYRGAVEFCPGDHVEVSVTARDTTVQTRFRSWECRLEQALKAES
jgi:hypothetical protein